MAGGGERVLSFLLLAFGASSCGHPSLGPPQRKNIPFERAGEKKKARFLTPVLTYPLATSGQRRASRFGLG